MSYQAASGGAPCTRTDIRKETKERGGLGEGRRTEEAMEIVRRKSSGRWRQNGNMWVESPQVPNGEAGQCRRAWRAVTRLRGRYIHLLSAAPKTGRARLANTARICRNFDLPGKK